MNKPDLRVVAPTITQLSNLAKHRDQELDAVTEGLMMELQIQGGQSLVFPLGDPKATSNKDAVRRWADRKLKSPVVTPEIYEDLKAQLESKLTNHFHG